MRRPRDPRRPPRGPVPEPEAPRRAGRPSTSAPPDLAELADLLARGPVRMVSLAPELPGALEAIEAIAAAGAVPAIAHTDATYERDAGRDRRRRPPRIHTFNGMRPLHHREPGVLGAVLEDPGVTCELIADGHHVHPAVMAARAPREGRRRHRPRHRRDRGRRPARRRVPPRRRRRSRVAGGRTETADGNLAGEHADHGRRGADGARAGRRSADARGDGHHLARRGCSGWLRKGRVAPGYDADLVGPRRRVVPSRPVGGVGHAA